MAAKKRSNKEAVAQRTKERQAQKQKRATIMCIVVISLFCLALLTYGAYRLSRSLNFFYQYGAAARVDGESLTAADYNFYFYRVYYEYMNSVGDDSYGIGTKPDESIPLDQQTIYEEDGASRTWQDFFISRADELITRTYFYYHQALESGYTLSEEQETDISYDFEEKIWFEAEEVNQSTIAAYLEEHYGKGMTEEIYKKNLRILFTANFYETDYEKSIAISNEELDDYYQQNAEDYNIVFYRLFYFSGKADTEEAQATRMKEAKAHADALAAQAGTEAEFIALAEEAQDFNDGNSYWSGASQLRREQNRFALSYFRAWLSQADRASGDTLVTEAANGYYVAMFISRYDNSYPVANLKWFTISGEGAESKLESFLNKWKHSDGSAASFFSLAEDYRDMDYSQDNRKLDVITHDDVNRATVPECMLQWCFEEDRVQGDVAGFTNEEGQIYVAWFDSYGDLCSRRLAYDELSGRKFREWKESGLAEVSVKHGFFFYLAAGN